MTLKNKVVWITGASSGIGKSLAIEMSKHDCKLILSSRRITELEKVKALCEDSSRVVVIPLDLAETASMKIIAEQAISAFGQVDILINNGGISQRSPIIETSIEVDRKLMEIDYLGTVALSKSILEKQITNQSPTPQTVGFIV